MVSDVAVDIADASGGVGGCVKVWGGRWLWVRGGDVRGSGASDVCVVVRGNWYGWVGFVCGDDGGSGTVVRRSACVLRVWRCGLL
jgi:hypothetical protein